jgi:hypothetical protein
LVCLSLLVVEMVAANRPLRTRVLRVHRPLLQQLLLKTGNLPRMPAPSPSRVEKTLTMMRSRSLRMETSPTSIAQTAPLLHQQKVVSRLAVVAAAVAVIAAAGVVPVVVAVVVAIADPNKVPKR